MTTISSSPVQSPRRLPPTLTLIGASRTLLGDLDLDGNAPRWEGGGVGFTGLACGEEPVPFISYCDTEALTDLGAEGETQFDPFNLWAGVRCSTMSSSIAAGEVRARAALEVDRHRQIEHEFWTGDVAAAESLPNLWLAQDGVAVELSGAGESSPLRYALAALQEALGSGSAGGPGCGRGMIHTTIQTAALWMAEQMVRREGALLLDAFDNVIVPGVGYDGSAPDGTIDGTGETAWAYATGIVDTRLGAVSMLSAVRVEDNDVRVIAQQPAIAYWDGCCHYGINVNLCLTGCGA